MNAILQPASLYRPMSPEDVEEVVQIECEIYPYPWTPGNFADSLRAGYCCWINDFGGETASYGVMLVAAGEAQLLNLGVATAWQRRGLGREMLLHLAEVARDHSAGIMLLEVRISNAPARGLYVKSGFRELGIRKNYYPAAQGREDAVVMELAL